MFKTLQSQVWAFDAEWVPDPNAGRALYRIPSYISDEEVIREMWRRGGATDENPQPFLKVALCRIVSVAAVLRRVSSDGELKIELLSLPRSSEDTEADIISRFLSAVGKYKPQLVGFNSVQSDLRIFIQRAVIHGISLPEFCARPDKPWEGVDYFAKESEFHIDLFQLLGGWGKGAPSLHEIATLSGIPGKLGLDGFMVPSLWLEGKIDIIRQYNECDALTTYLLWLRVALVSGLIDLEQYNKEEELVKDVIHSLSQPHLTDYLREWKRLTTNSGTVN